MHNKTRKNCIKLIKTIEKCKKVVYYEAINKEETGRGTMNNEGGGIVDRRDHDRCQELYVKYRQFMYWYVKKHFPDLPEEDIRDILQEVWTSLLNAIDKLYDKGDEGRQYENRPITSNGFFHKYAPFVVIFVFCKRSGAGETARPANR